MTLSGHSGDEVYRHEVYGKPGVTVQPDEGGTHRSCPLAILGVFLNISINLNN